MEKLFSKSLNRFVIWQRSVYKMHKSLERNNMTRVLTQSLLKLEILFLLKCNQNLSLRGYEATDTNVKVKPVSYIVLQMLNLRLFHYNKSQNAREAFQQINFGVVIILLTLESKGKFGRSRILDFE